MSIAAPPLVLGLQGIYHPRYAGFNMKVPDQVRLDEFLKEFREFEKNGNLPRLVVMLLPQDHTNGTAPGYPTPRACVADNDLALGRLVEAVSRSRYWKESAIFVTEDDAQNGLDHVDGHRTVGMVISPWVRRKAVDSTFYTTINMYRTIEQILGLPPVEPVRPCRRADVLRFHLRTGFFALRGAAEPDPARRDEPARGRARRTPQAAGARNRCKWTSRNRTRRPSSC